MANLTPEEFCSRVLGAGLAEPAQLDRAMAELGKTEITTDGLVRVLQRQEILTTLQVEKILKGDRVGYFYGKYKVLYLIGAGSFARVFRCENTQTKETIALKVLRKRYRDDMAQLEQFLREGRMGLKLRHPNIVSIFEVVPDKHNPYMTMEFVEGQTLRELIKIRGKLPADVALKLIQDIVAGLSYAITQGVTHRDLKMSNVLVTSTGRAKLVDFGLAALADPKNDREVLDTPNARAIDYAALERGTNVRNGDPRSDLYFAGVMLYHMLIGKSPLTEAFDRAQRLNVSRFQEVPLIQSVDPEIPNVVAALVTKSMEYEPTARYQSAAEFLADIKSTSDRLERGETSSRRELNQTLAGLPPPDIEGNGRTVMVIESKADLQETFRERLKSKGYRVLVFSDPARALARFQPGDSPPADCVVFCAPELGTLALQAFNRFASDEHTANIPAILLVDRQQEFVIRQAKMAPHRLMLEMPLKVRELRAALLHLLAPQKQAEA